MRDVQKFCGSALASIMIQHCYSMRIRIQGLDEQKCKILQLTKILFFSNKNCIIFLRREARQKKTYLSSLFSFCESFLFTWIRIYPTKINAGPDPQHWYFAVYEDKRNPSAPYT